METKKQARRPKETHGPRANLRTQNYRAIPLNRNNIGQFIVEAKLDDREVLLMVDTGASHTILDKSSALKLGLTMDGPYKTSPAGRRPVKDFSKCFIHEFVVQGFSYGPHDICIIDLSAQQQILQPYEGRIVAGLLGADFLNRRNAIIDYRKATLYLEESKKAFK